MGKGLPNEFGSEKAKSAVFFTFSHNEGRKFIRQGVCEHAAAYELARGFTP
jgi:hypothetical protein